MSSWQVIQGDCLDVLRGMAANSIDAVVSDPPYGLSFMGKRWDYDVPSVDVWAERLRVLKPGGHLLAFAGTRTQHRMAVRIEDAGFEIRDMLAWVYGSGFPKSMDVSKAIDKVAGAEREVVGTRRLTGTARIVGGQGGATAGRAGAMYETHATRETLKLTAPATDLARQWSGWGTALKPSLEPITMARKPFASTVAANVQAWGTGAINVDGCRVGTQDTGSRNHNGAVYDGVADGYQRPGKSSYTHKTDWEMPPLGRWPANLIHDGSDEVVGVFPSDADKSAARFFYVAKASKAERDAGCGDLPIVTHQSGMGGAMPVDDDGNDRDRFKAQSRNHHPTVKPAALMAYLCRLVTPPGGVVLDPFTGSGSTGIGAIREGFNFVGIEREAEYVEIARKRIGHAANHLYQGAP